MADMHNKTTEERIQEETAKRLAEMEKEEYKFPPQITKIDWIIIIGLIILSLLLIMYCVSEDL